MTIATACNASAWAADYPVDGVRQKYGVQNLPAGFGTDVRRGRALRACWGSARAR